MRVRRGVLKLAWRFLMFQKDSALAHWLGACKNNAPHSRGTMIVALARKLLIALWRLCGKGTLEGDVPRPASERSGIEIRPFRPRLQARESAEDGLSRRGPDHPPLAFMPGKRMGSPPQSFATDANE
jgi:hypothetical protein